MICWRGAATVVLNRSSSLRAGGSATTQGGPCCLVFFALLQELFVLVSMALALTHSDYWLVLTGLVGLNLLQSAFTDRSPLKGHAGSGSVFADETRLQPAFHDRGSLVPGVLRRPPRAGADRPTRFVLPLKEFATRPPFSGV